MNTESGRSGSRPPASDPVLGSVPASGLAFESAPPSVRSGSNRSGVGSTSRSATASVPAGASYSGPSGDGGSPSAGSVSGPPSPRSASSREPLTDEAIRAPTRLITIAVTTNSASRSPATITNCSFEKIPNSFSGTTNGSITSCSSRKYAEKPRTTSPTATTINGRLRKDRRIGSSPIASSSSRPALAVSAAIAARGRCRTRSALPG